MKRERSSSTGARTGQWTGKVRQKGPVVRRRGELLDAEEVLAKLCCRLWQSHDVLLRDTREAFIEEEWYTLSAWLINGGAKLRRNAMEDLIVRARALRVACVQRHSTPVWIASSAKLHVRESDERLSEWAALIAKRDASLPLDADDAYVEARKNGARDDVEALSVLYHLVDATIDDVAKLCDTPRGDIECIVWADEAARVHGRRANG